jgi:predicted DNA-binding transcriptional regulator YafY
MIEVKEILRLWLDGWSLREVTRLAGVDRKTVRRYVKTARACGMDRDGAGAARLLATSAAVGTGNIWASSIDRSLESFVEPLPSFLVLRVGLWQACGPLSGPNRQIQSRYAPARLTSARRSRLSAPSTCARNEGFSPHGAASSRVSRRSR